MSKTEQVQLSDKEMALVQAVADRTGESVDAVASKLVSKEIAKRVKKRTGKGPGKVYDLRKRG